VTDHRTLLRTCRLLQSGRASGVDETTLPNNNTTSIPKKLADFIEQCSKLNGLPFDFDKVVRDWRHACKDIKDREVWRPLEDALCAEVFKRVCSYNAVTKWFERKNFQVTE